MDHISKWAKINNLTLNINKIVKWLCASRELRTCLSPWDWWYKASQGHHSPWCFHPGQSGLSFGEHVDHLVAQGAQPLYALRMLKHHGLNGPHPGTVANSFGKINLCIPCMWGLIGSEGLLRLQSVLSRAGKQGFLPPNQPAFDIICEKMTWDFLMQSWMTNNHDLNHLLPRSNRGYTICVRGTTTA